MSDTVKDIALKYLREHNTITISTYGEDGPWATALFYVNDGWTLYFLSDPKTLHCRNIAANPLVAATINEDYRDWRKIKGIQLRGTAEIVSGKREKMSAISLYVKKYPFVGELFSSPSRLAGAMLGKVSSTTFYRLKPQRILYIDNERGFGHREEVWVEDAAIRN